MRDELGWAIVTGASSGLGREFTRALADRGYPVLAVARRQAQLADVARQIERSGGKVETLVADLSTRAGVDALLDAAGRREVELVVNNAGVAAYGPFASMELERQRALVRLNVDALVSITRELLPGMLERGRGGIINVASQMAFQPMPYFASYAASKAFVLSFSEALAEELRGSGVRVMALAPGFVRTEFSDIAGSHDPERRFPHLAARYVVERALGAYARGRTVKIVGFLYTVLTVAGRFAPRAALRRLMGFVMRPRPAS